VTAVTVRVPAKVNVQLAVGGRGPDGFHDLANVFLAVGLYDRVTAEPADRLRITAEGRDVAGVPLDESNLAARAAIALAERHGLEPNVRLHIEKDIPVAGGMAGGSADAAAALVGLATLWKLEMARDELAMVAAKLGSDVPFLLHGGTALGTGRGELLVPVLSRHTFHWVLAFDRAGLRTPDVFGELDRLRDDGRSSRLGAVEPVLEALASGDPRQLALLLGNDLQAAAVSLRPGLRRTLRAGVDAGALAGLVSGSGPTCAFLCADGERAVRVAASLAGAGVCRTVRVAQGPVPGARVVNGDEAPRPVPPEVHA